MVPSTGLQSTFKNRELATDPPKSAIFVSDGLDFGHIKEWLRLSDWLACFKLNYSTIHKKLSGLAISA